MSSPVASLTAPRITSLVTDDGYRHFARVWDVPSPIGRVLCLHGIISHGGWYLESCRRMAEAGLEVHFFDRRGSGLNAQGRGHVEHYERRIADVQQYLESLPANLPRLLVGISWGGKLAPVVAARCPDEVDGLVLVSPGIFAQRGPNALQKRLLRFAASRRLQRRKVQIPLQEAELFTSVPRWQRWIEQDPLVLREVTIRFAAENVKLDALAATICDRVVTPTLLMLAGRDRIIDNPRVEAFFQNMIAVNKQVIRYPEAAHTFEFEPDPQPYFSDLIGWLRSQCIDTE